MSVYKRGGVYWYDFWFRGQRIRESTGLTNKTAAEQAQAIRKAGISVRAPRMIGSQVCFSDLPGRHKFVVSLRSNHEACLALLEFKKRDHVILHKLGGQGPAYERWELVGTERQVLLDLHDVQFVRATLSLN